MPLLKGRVSPARGGVLGPGHPAACLDTGEAGTALSGWGLELSDARPRPLLHQRGPRRRWATALASCSPACSWPVQVSHSSSPPELSSPTPHSAMLSFGSYDCVIGACLPTKLSSERPGAPRSAAAPSTEQELHKCPLSEPAQEFSWICSLSLFWQTHGGQHPPMGHPRPVHPRPLPACPLAWNACPCPPLCVGLEVHLQGQTPAGAFSEQLCPLQAPALRRRWLVTLLAMARIPVSPQE